MTTNTIELKRCRTIGDLKDSLQSFTDDCMLVNKDKEPLITVFYSIDEDGEGRIVITDD